MAGEQVPPDLQFPGVQSHPLAVAPHQSGAAMLAQPVDAVVTGDGPGRCASAIRPMLSRCADPAYSAAAIAAVSPGRGEPTASSMTNRKTARYP